jgi:adenylosuccinate lyase
MELRSIFLNLSPLDHRYFLANRDLFEKLSLYLSEEANIKYCIQSELALITCLIDRAGDIINKEELKAKLASLPALISPVEVAQEEEKTQHNIRALVNVIKKYVPAEVSHLVHMGATSVDILDTSFACRIRDAVRKVILPLLIELEQSLSDLALKEAATPQVGRTHGQHAVPITFGFAMAEYVARLGKSILRLETKSDNLRGKLAGAVGAYNATRLIVTDPEGLEWDYLKLLGLKPSEHSTQLVEPEYLLELLLEINTAFGIIANLADDLRHLQRSELGEVKEGFSAQQVGSSTMPQKRNPWNSEHVKSLWKTFAPRVMTFFMDQISEHQRDLTNSASQRFVAEYLAGFTAAVARTRSVIGGLYVDKNKMLHNINLTGGMVLAEALYILLSLAGEKDGHEIIRQLTLEAEKEGKALLDILQRKKAIWEKLTAQFAKTYQLDPVVFFSHPEQYCGMATQKATDLARLYQQQMKELTDRLA